MPSAFDKDFLFLISDLARHMRTQADQRAREHGMTRAQWVILLRLERQPNLSQNELAALAEVEPITVARLVDRLEARGLVERHPDPKDRRVWRLRLTPAAAPVLRKIHGYRAELNDQLTAGVDRATLKTMATGLLKLKTNLSRARSRQPGSDDVKN
ncbi:MAG: MarR family transcriptional regulator [Xanthobacteraceae bacterium]